MPSQGDAFLRHQQARFMRPDAARFIRPDAARFLKPGTRVEDVFPALAIKYSPNQPRVPAGSGIESGRWSDTEGDASDSEASGDVDVAARRGNELQCELQYRRDTFICNSVGMMSCWKQAMTRYAACLAGQPIPPLNF